MAVRFDNIGAARRRERSLMLLLCATGGAAAFGLPAAAQAQTSAATAATAGPTALETLIVTARRREEDIQKVPVAVTAVTPEVLKQQNITNIADLSHIAPSLTIDTSFNRLNVSYTIRGLPTGVVTYFADAPGSAGPSQTPLMDISSVQILNGPQGTLFGRSSAAGAVLITPQHPDMESFGGYAEGIFGDYSRVQLTGVVNIPIIPGKLALRAAVNTNHIDGYTHLIGTDRVADQVNNQQYRLGLEYKGERFDDYLVGSYLNVDQTGAAEVLAGANVNYGLYNLPPAFGPIVFGGVCAQSVAVGFSSSVGSCVAQRLAILSNIRATLASEFARVKSSDSAARYTLPSFVGQPIEEMEHYASVVDVAQLDLGEIAGAKVGLKNIFSFTSVAADTSGPTDGIGGLTEAASFGVGASNIGQNNEIGNRVTTQLGPAAHIWNEDFQVHLDAGSGLLVGTAGVFYTKTNTPRDLHGTTNIYQIFGGVLNPILGWNSAQGFVDGGYAKETAVYGQATLDLSRVGIHGLSLTGGYRYSWDKSSIGLYPAVVDYASGIFFPGPTLTQTRTSSKGYNYTVSVSEQVTNDLMAYVTVARAYVPGGINPFANNTAQTSLPNYSPTFGAETVLDYEGGVKSQFKVGGVAARINAAVYNYDFSNITEGFTGQVGTSSILYYANIAAARLRGVEVEAVVVPTDAWELRIGYSYNQGKYTKWTGQDPFNVAKAGNPLCVPSSPPGQCFLDLTNNPFPHMPRQQGHVSLVWHAPIDPALGRLTATATAYGQSRVWLEAAAARDMQTLPLGPDGISLAPYKVLNLRLDWDDIRGTPWNAALFVNNVTDKVYAVGGAPQLQTLGFAVKNYAPPRMWGVEVTRRFGP